MNEPSLPRPRSARPSRVLVAGGQPPAADRLSLALCHEGWEVLVEGDGAAAVRTAREWGADAVVLDGTPAGTGGDVRAVLDRLRRQTPGVPVLVLTGSDAAGRPAGPVGGDDRLAEPYAPEDVVGRLRGLLRRAGSLGAVAVRQDALLVVGDLTLDEETRAVTRDGEPVRLTATEFEVLRYLMRNARRVLSKRQILSRVWGHDGGGQANVVELYISYLRRKIDAGREPMIHTRRGAGYLISPAADRPARRRAGHSA